VIPSNIIIDFTSSALRSNTILGSEILDSGQDLNISKKFSNLNHTLAVQIMKLFSQAGNVVLAIWNQ
jgi:hypothetical protein